LVIYIIEQETGGPMVMVFVPSTMEPYRINAYFDALSARYMADYRGPINVIGNIFSLSNYTVTLEVTGVDFDNLFLAVRLKLEFPVSIYRLVLLRMIL
jgi:hypothetical protein